MVECTRQSGLNSDGKSGPCDPPAQPPKCPECNSTKTWKDGLRYCQSNSKPIQRYLCRSCGYRFSESNVKVNIHAQSLKSLNPRSNLPNVGIIRGEFPVKKRVDSLSFQRGKDIASHRVTVAAKTINTLRDYNRERRVCVTEDGAKNLAKVESRQKRAAGATKPTQADIKGKIIEHLWWLKKQGYKESTIQLRARLLKGLIRRGANLLDPESVKESVAKSECKDGTKAQYIIAYSLFAAMLGIVWNAPIYKQTEKFPFIPTEAELDQLIAACRKKRGALLQLLKETAMRIGEAWQLKWIDIDFERNIVRVNNPEKNSKPRIFKVSDKLMGMLNGLPKKSEKVFGNALLNTWKSSFCTLRKRLAERLQNPRIKQITFHTFRHWKATMLYHEIKDILYVMNFLGHKNINNTLLYIQLEQALFDSDKNDHFTAKVARTLNEACELVEAGFEYVTDIEGGKIFRKRK